MLLRVLVTILLYVIVLCGTVGGFVRRTVRCFVPGVMRTFIRGRGVYVLIYFTSVMFQTHLLQRHFY